MAHHECDRPETGNAGDKEAVSEEQTVDASPPEELSAADADAAFNLLLSYLAAPPQGSSLLCSSARRFILSRRLMESLGSSNASSVDVQQLLTGVKQQAALLDRGSSAVATLDPGAAFAKLELQPLQQSRSCAIT